MGLLTDGRMILGVTDTSYFQVTDIGVKICSERRPGNFVARLEAQFRESKLRCPGRRVGEVGKE